jgi:hypothetical protein
MEIRTYRRILMEDMKKWVNQGSYRTISIEPHCSGVRVTLKEGYGFNESVSTIGDTIQEAFDRCVRCLPESRVIWKKQEMERLQKDIDEKQTELKEKKENLKRLKEQLNG